MAAECNTQALADYAGLLGQIDAAVIAAPTSLHHRIALRLLEAGVHVLVEKPLCATLAEADELVEPPRGAATSCSRWATSSDSIRPSTPPPHIRSPKYIEAVRTSGFTFRSTDVGVVLDLMIHDIDLVLSLVGCAAAEGRGPGLSVLGGHEDVANARLEFECGCVATLSASRVSYEAVRRMQVWSAAGLCGHRFRRPHHHAGPSQRNAACGGSSTSTA